MARRLQELNVVTTRVGSSIILIKDTRNGSQQDHQILANDFLADRVPIGDIGTNIGQIPRLIDNGSAEAALPAVSGENLTKLEDAIRVGNGSQTGLVSLSDRVDFASGIGGNIAATPAAVKTLNDDKTSRTADESPTGNWTFNSTGAVRVPVGPTSAQPTGAAGDLRFNSEDETFEGFNGTAWEPLDEKALTSKTGRTGDESPTGSWSFNSTGALKVPAGTTAEQPTGIAGHLRFNSDQEAFEGFDGTVWGELGGGGGATGGGDDEVFVENDKIVSADYTLPSNKNASSTGPLTINTDVTVTVAAGARWVIV